MLIDSQCNFLPKKLRPMCKWKKSLPCHPKDTNQLNWVTIIYLELASKNVMVIDQSKVFFLERNGKKHCIENHHTKKVEGPKEDKPKSTEARKFTKRYYHSKVVDNTI